MLLLVVAVVVLMFVAVGVVVGAIDDVAVVVVAAAVVVVVFIAWIASSRGNRGETATPFCAGGSWGPALQPAPPRLSSSLP